MKKDKNKNINCDVKSCKNHDCDNDECALEEINISCNCNDDDENASKDETICDSYEKKEDSE